MTEPKKPGGFPVSIFTEANEALEERALLRI
jgi:hypothetical protein